MALKFNSGDRVRFLNDVGGGIVIRVDANDMIHVQTPDGFEIPVSSKELIHAGNFTVPDTDQKEIMPPAKEPKPLKVKPDQAPKQSGQTPEQSDDKGLPRNISADAPVNLLIGFIPENPGPVFSSSLACYLINDSPYFAYYSVGTRERGNFYHLTSGLIESGTKNLLSVFDQTALSKISDLHLQLIWLCGGRYNRKSPFDALVDIQVINFSKESYYHENAFFNEKAVLFTITGKEEEIGPMGQIEVTDTARAAKADKEPRQEIPVVKKEIPSDIMEVDLHMDEQDIQKSQISLSGILALQMSRFHSALEEAVSKKLRRLVIIHGVGQGTLKMQIRKELQEKYPEYLYQDASFREYGFGATMVHLTSDKKQ